MTTFMESIKNQQQQYTENGAVGYATTSHDLLDLNFAIPSFRKDIGYNYLNKFDKMIHEDANLTLRWLLFLRDIREGMGERDTFRNFLYCLSQFDSELCLNFIDKVDIAEFGRYDDYVDLFGKLDKELPLEKKIRDKIVEILSKKLNEDIVNCMQKKPISLLAKWLPSEKASSKLKKKLASELAIEFGMTKQEYRKTLSKLRKYLRVVEVDMSDNKWSDIKYEKVPSGANLRYSDAFYRHDAERRKEYLTSLAKGETKINANALFLYDIVHKYGVAYNYWYCDTPSLDETLEQLWKAQEPPKEFANTLVIRDGSGSMMTSVGNSDVTALDVANALTIYLSEYNSEEYKNKFITFSRIAKLVDISDCNTLLDKLLRLRKEADVEDTNVENVLSLVLRAMKESGKSVDRLLFISDMEYNIGTEAPDEVVFEHWQKKYKEEGFIMPKLVFWNVNSRTNTIPVNQNENGVVLVSGFSKNIVDMVMSPQIDPYKVLLDRLMTERYNVVDKVIQ